MFTMPSTKPLAILLTVVALLLLSVTRVSTGFSLEKMCEARCSYGRGGNLCNCNAFHFAGKRAGAAYSSRQSLLDLQDDDLMGLSAVKGGESGAGSGNSESYPPRGVGRSSGHRDGANNGDVVVEGFIGVEGSQRSAVHRLASLLKDAIDERFADNRRTSRRWQSGVPYEEDGALF